MYRNLVTFLDYLNPIFGDLLSKKSLNLWHKVSNFFCFTRVQMVGPCGDGLPCLSTDVDQRLLGGFRNLLWLSGGKTHNVGIPEDRSEISPSQRNCVCVYALSGLQPVGPKQGFSREERAVHGKVQQLSEQLHRQNRRSSEQHRSG